MKIRHIPFPTSGGAYRYADGQLIREGELVNNDPSLPAAPPIEQATDLQPVATAERWAEPGQALPPIESTDPQPRARGRRQRED